MDTGREQTSDAHADESRAASDPVSWVNQYGDYLYNLAFSRLRDRVAAEDAVQETFLAALKARDSFAGRSSERTWLAGILKYKIIDHLRRVFRDHPDRESDTPIHGEGSGFHSSGEWTGHWNQRIAPIDWHADPSRQVERREFWEVFDRCLKKLSPRHASVFILREIEELTGDSICKELGITPTNLWVILHRSRHQLRQCLETNWIGVVSPKKKRADS
jgi:RNA polymerase sigma-70 factor (ECF subfamily)